MGGGITLALALAFILDGIIGFIPGFENIGFGRLTHDLTSGLSGQGETENGLGAAALGTIAWVVDRDDPRLAAVRARGPQVMRRSLPVAAATALACLLSTAIAAAAVTVDVPTRLSTVIPKAHDSGVVVLLPSTINLDYEPTGRLYIAGAGNKKRGSYTLRLSGTKNCSGNACFLAEFLGEKGAKLGYTTTNVNLALGMKGFYKPLSCGASCSPPSIAWIQKGVRYQIQAKALGGRKAFVALANSAIKNGNRK